jgi:hypothetical protein
LNGAPLEETKLIAFMFAPLGRFLIEKGEGGGRLQWCAMIPRPSSLTQCWKITKSPPIMRRLGTRANDASLLVAGYWINSCSGVSAGQA